MTVDTKSGYKFRGWSQIHIILEPQSIKRSSDAGNRTRVLWVRATDASPYTAYPLLLVCKQVLISSLKLRNQLHLVLWVYVRKTVELTTRQTLRYAICLMKDISYSYSSMITQSVTGLISCVIKSTNWAYHRH